MSRGRRSKLIACARICWHENAFLPLMSFVFHLIWLKFSGIVHCLEMTSPSKFQPFQDNLWLFYKKESTRYYYKAFRNSREWLSHQKPLCILDQLAARERVQTFTQAAELRFIRLKGTGMNVLDVSLCLPDQNIAASRQKVVCSYLFFCGSTDKESGLHTGLHRLGALVLAGII